MAKQRFNKTFIIIKIYYILYFEKVNFFNSFLRVLKGKLPKIPENVNKLENNTSPN